MPKRPSHPGKTAAERRILDQIGCGEFSPHMAPVTRKNMLRRGVIIESGWRVVGRDALGDIRIPQFSMPTGIHMQWCKAMAHQAEIDGLDEPELNTG
jgi:hypothetical protein